MLKTTATIAGTAVVGYALLTIGHYDQRNRFVKENKKSPKYKKYIDIIPPTVPTFFSKHDALYKEYDVLAKILYDANIKFWAVAGTSLGAGRFGEIIPWDDDIDIGMYEDDVERAVKAIKDSGKISVRYHEYSIWRIGHRIDLFSMKTLEKTDGEELNLPERIAYSGKMARYKFPKEWFLPKELETINLVKFGDSTQLLPLAGGNDSYLDRAICPSWKTSCRIKLPHDISILDKFLYLTNPLITKSFELKPLQV